MVKGPERAPLGRLNELTGREWIRFTRSWFVENPPRRSAAELRHPAKFPDGLARAFIEFFTLPGQWVLDPFAGTGSTLLAARELGRPSVGIELQGAFADLARDRLAENGGAAAPVEARVVVGDGRAVRELWHRLALPAPGLVFTSPPYWNMLGTSRGGVRSVHRRRAERGLAQRYSEDPRDLGNRSEYEEFLSELVRVLRASALLLLPGRYLVVVLQNLRDPEGRLRRLAWDVAERLDRLPLRFQGERIWCQDSKPLGIWGYPTTFVPNVHHHYCLIFRRGRGRSPAPPSIRRGRSARRRRRASPRPRRGAAGRSAPC
jgi:hypothetical protein